MFPDITCDDIFRLETARLWLRWLRAADASALTTIVASAGVGETGTFDTARSSGGAERFILHARATTASGQALVLAVTAKTKSRTLAGIVSGQVADRGEIDIGYLIAPQHAGRGFASEAVSCLADAAFNLTQTRALVAQTHPDNKASRRVLEKCGFVQVAAASVALGGTDGYDRFRRERSTWMPSTDRRLPSMVHQPRPTLKSES